MFTLETEPESYCRGRCPKKTEGLLKKMVNYKREWDVLEIIFFESTMTILG
jgi:hypothetical protein